MGSDGIKSAAIVCKQTEDFLLQQVPRLKRREKEALVGIICHQQESKPAILKTDGDIIRRLNSTPLEDLATYVNSEVNALQAASASRAQKRSQGIRKQAAKFQDWAVSFQKFLSAYSGIVDVVRAADSQFGNVAFAALSVLFAVSRAQLCFSKVL